MAKKRMTIGKKMALGFGIILTFLLILAGLSFMGVRGIVRNAEEVIQGNKLDAILAQKEVDHLNWAAKVNSMLTDAQHTKLDVEVDEHKCGFGKWFYGEDRRQAEKLIPSLGPLLKEIEEPHRKLHQSAAEINKVLKKEHPGLLLNLYQRLNDHTNWFSQVSAALAKRAAGDNNGNFTLGVETDPTKCEFGRFLAAPETAKLCAAFPELKTALDACRAPHQALHQSAGKIEKLVNAGEMKEAMALYQGEMQEALKGLKTHLEGAIQAERSYREAAGRANAIYGSQTLPNLVKVQDLLSRIRVAAKSQIMTDEGMLNAAMGTKTSVTALGLLALITGILLSFAITRSIIRAMKGASQQMGAAAEQVASASVQVSSSSQSLAEGTTQQAASLEETSSSMEEMASMTRQNAGNAQEADSLMAGAAQVVDKAHQSMQELTRSMQEISAASEDTAKIIKTIDEIAFQTNLLALNAAVEAARAGEAGAGFAVVADEVRNLALRAAEAAKNTANLIEGTMNKVKEGAALVGKTSEDFSQVAVSTAKAKELVAEINAASKEQTQGVEQINKAVSEVDKVVQQNAANAEESASAAEELSSQAETLRQVIRDMLALVGGTNNGGPEEIRGELPSGEGKVKGFLQYWREGNSRVQALTPRAGAPGVGPAGQPRPEEIIPLEDTAATFRDF